MIEIAQNPIGPEIQTARLRLRLHRLADLNARVEITADPPTMRFVGGPQDREENFNRLLRYAGQWALLGRGLFAIEEIASGHVVGEAGLADFGRGLGPDFDDVPEAAWMIARSATGKGYATEALLAILDWLETTFGAGRSVCIIDPDNIPSLRVAAKLGFSPFRDATYKGRRLILHERGPASPQVR